MSASERPAGAYVETALLYVEDVLEGAIPACELIRAACRRQLEDLKRAAAGDKSFTYRFDVRAAEKVCRYIETLPHTKGEWARNKELIRLEPWQVFIYTSLFGWLRVETGLRRFKKGYLEVARKNAKTTSAAGAMLYMLTEDGEAGPEVYSNATKKEQASIVFNVAREMARKSPDLRNHYGLIVQEHKLKVAGDGGECRALDAKGSTQDGLNPHCLVNDELHAWKGRTLYEVLESALGARAQPLELNITTAGYDRSGICYELRTYAANMLQGRTVDEEFFAAIYTLDKDDDPFDEANWIKANPNLGVSVYPENLRGDALKAKAVAAKRNGFLTKRMNVWCNAGSAWMDMAKWDACADPDLRLKDFHGQDCIAALDLATKKDIVSRIIWFVDPDGVHTLFARHYVPEARLEEDENAAYRGWVEEGWLTATAGSVTNQNTVRDDLLEDLADLNCLEVVFDRYQGAKLMAELDDEGLVVVDLANNVANLSEPTKELEALVLSGKLRHQGDPVLGWMAANVCVHQDEKGNVYPRKDTKDSKNKIDGIVAGVMGLNRVMAGRPDDDDFDSYLQHLKALGGDESVHAA